MVNIESVQQYVTVDNCAPYLVWLIVASENGTTVAVAEAEDFALAMHEVEREVARWAMRRNPLPRTYN